LNQIEFIVLRDDLIVMIYFALQAKGLAAALERSTPMRVVSPSLLSELPVPQMADLVKAHPSLLALRTFSPDK